MIYHGCGNVNRIFEDFIEVGVDAYNPLEFKAGLDAVRPSGAGSATASVSAATWTCNCGRRALR